MKNIFLGAAVCAILMGAYGCSTVRYTSEGFGKGIYEDVKGSWQLLRKADSWWKANTW
jgi:uncharacterized protein YceK